MTRPEFARKHPGLEAVFGGNWWRALDSESKIVRGPFTKNELKSKRLYLLSNLISQTIGRGPA